MFVDLLSVIHESVVDVVGRDMCEVMGFVVGYVVLMCIEDWVELGR